MWKSKKVLVMLSCTAVLLCLGAGAAFAGDAEDRSFKDHMKAYKAFQKNCTLCHDSVADPEKPGRTRDDWHLVVKVMHSYGLELTDQEAELIINLLYDLRRGIERYPG